MAIIHAASSEQVKTMLLFRPGTLRARRVYEMLLGLRRDYYAYNRDASGVVASRTNRQGRELLESAENSKLSRAIKHDSGEVRSVSGSY